MKFEKGDDGLCANCQHTEKWCVCAKVPDGGSLVFKTMSTGAIGWTAPLGDVNALKDILENLHALRDGGPAPECRGMAPELGMPYNGESLVPASQCDVAVRDAYNAGVAAAREAISAAKYDAERDRREWSVREVEVPEWKEATK